MILIGLLLRGLLRLAARLLFLAFILLVLAKALSFGLALYAESHVEEVKALASRLLGVPVEMESIETSWKGFTPRLWLRRLVVGGERETLLLGDVQVAIDYSALPWWRTNLPISVVLTGTHVQVVREADGSTHIRGLVKPGGTLKPPALIMVWNGTIDWQDLKRDARIEESRLDIQLVSRGRKSRLSIRSRSRNLLIRADIEGKVTTANWSARIWARGRDLQTSGAFQPYLPDDYRISHQGFDFETWSYWQKGRHQSTRLQFRLEEAVLSHPGSPPLEANNLRGDLLFQVLEHGWSLQLAGFSVQLDQAPPWPDMRLALRATADGQLLGIDRLDLESLRPLAKLAPLDAEQREMLEQTAPRGRLEAIRVNLPDAPKQGFARTRILDFHSNAWGKLPGIGNLRGELLAEPDQLHLTLDSRESILEMPKLFRKPIQLEHLAGDLLWRRLNDAEWRLETRNLRAGNADIETLTRLEITGQDGQPLLFDIQTDFGRVDVRRLRDYYPVGIMKPKLAEWLDQALVKGQVPSGSFLLHGPAEDFPYHKSHAGHFEVLFDVKDLELHYHDAWPPLEQLQASVRFHGNSMDITADQGRLYHSRVKALTARIRSLKPLSPLKIEGTVEGPLEDEIRILRDTPLKEKLARHVEGMETRGQARMEVNLQIPLRKGGHPRFHGRLALKKARLRLKHPQFVIDGIQGTLEIDDQGVRGKGLKGQILGSLFRFDIDPVEGSTRIRARGRITADGLLHQYQALSLLRPRGSTDLELLLDLPREDSGPDRQAQLRLSSSLEGMSLEAPPPMGKSAESRLPLSARLSLAEEPRTLELKAGSALELGLQMAAGGENRLDLKLDHLPLRHWVHWFTELPEPDGKGMTLSRIRLEAGSMEAYPLQAGPITLDLQRHPHSWRGSVNGTAIAGRIHMELDPARRKLSLNLDHLRLDTRQEIEALKRTREVTVDPRTMASLEVHSKSFFFNAADLGRLTAVTAHTPKGQEIRRLDLAGGIADIRSSGEWIEEDGTSVTHIEGTLNTADMGRFLKEALDLDFLAGSKAYLSFDLSWPGAPYQFELDELAGRMQLDMTAGRFLNIKPGAARILGLLNVRAIGRRLQFGFKDVYEKGLAFDTIMGSFHLDHGLVYTNDLEISAPSATIRIAGSTDLGLRTHDQVVTVSPRLDATLPIAGAIAGGPATGLVVLLAQQAFSKKLEKIQEVRYSVTGSWDDPKISPLAGKNEPEAPEETFDP